MAEDTPTSSTAPPPEDLSINISILSPSVSVNTPLNFAALPAATTVAQLKGKIRDALDFKPSNDQQRLIHQGKLLARENETLLEVFGEQKIRDSDQLVVHLVIRDVVDHHHHSPSHPAASGGQSPAPNPNARIPNPLSAFNPQSSHTQPHGHHHQPQRFGRPAVIPGHTHSPFARINPGIQTPGNQVPEHLLTTTPPPPPPQLPQQQHLLQHYLNQIGQRGGINTGHQTTNPPFPLGNNGQGVNSPHQENQPYVREGIGPHGEIYRVTMNSALIGPNGQIHPINLQNLQQGNGTSPGGPFSTNDVHNILRGADASQATSIMANAMHRSASGASLANLNLSGQRQQIPTPGVTVPRRPGSTVSLSNTATPEPTRTSSYGSVSAPPTQSTASAPSNQPEVYIVNSPTGPRALLINNSSDVYYTPAARLPAPPLLPGFAPTWFQPALQPQPQSQARTGTGFGTTRSPAQQQNPAAAPPQQQAPQQGNIRVGLYQGPAVQQHGQPQHVRAQAIGPGAAQQLHPANPEGGLAGALLAALWPHVWLIIRLSVFVWWFTASDTSWTRWLTIMLVATVVFVINTGIFNGVANDLFHPVRQHLEGLMPLAGPERNRNRNRNDGQAGGARPAQGGQNSPNAAAQDRQGEPDPAQAAARLVAQRRNNNASWLLDQVRRLERAGLLFLASIAPGVAERHIAHLEAEARAERERREAAERAERERREAEERAAAASAAAPTEGENERADAVEKSEEASASGRGGSEPQSQQNPAAVAN